MTSSSSTPGIDADEPPPGVAASLAYPSSRVPVMRAIYSAIKAVDECNRSASDLDKNIKLLGYTCEMASVFLSMTSSSPSLAKGLADVHLNMSFSRYAIRLLNGLPMSLVAAAEGSWETPDISGVEEYVEGDEVEEHLRPGRAALWASKTLSWSMLGYYPTEFLAFAKWQFPGLLHDSTPPPRRAGDGPLTKLLAAVRDGRNWRDGNWWSSVSCGFWLWYIVADIVVQVDKIRRLKAVIEAIEGSDKDAAGKDSTVKRLRAELGAAQNMLLRESLFLLPGVHYALPGWATDPLLPRWAVGGLMFGEAVAGWAYSVGGVIVGK
mmetsp:Transcript_5915/g.11194  ORF Transcript_5915/g.11194 Transcript_5915/m.11194 type:complete len:322 (+) Transcript_5915:89-1054(+)